MIKTTPDMKKCLPLLGCLALFIAAGNAFAGHTLYTITDLGSFDSTDRISTPADINNKGQVVGSASHGASNSDHAFLWDPVNGLTDLGTLGGGQSRALGINDAGQVVGWAETAEGVTHAFLWNPDSPNAATGTMIDIGILDNGYSSTAEDINNNGQVVGWTAYNSIYSGPKAAFLWDPVNGMTDLGTLGGLSSQAFGINDAGQVVGTAKTADWEYSDETSAFLWNPDSPNSATGTMTDLGRLVSDLYYSYASSATDINNAGQVAGWSYFTGSAYITDAFLWNPDSPNAATGTMIDIGSIGSASNTIDINEVGHVVGNYLSSVQNLVFLWENASEGMIYFYLSDQQPHYVYPIVPDDPLFGVFFYGPAAINNSGQIVLMGLKSDNSRTALLLTPTDNDGDGTEIDVTDSIGVDNDLQMPFGDVTVGISSTAETATISNAGNATLNVSGIQLTGADTGQFSLDINGGASPCGATALAIAPSGNCTVTITFNPATTGAKTATLEITSDDPDEGTVNVALTGTGLSAVTNNPPDQPQLVYPSNGQQSLPTTVTLEWEPVTDPDGDTVSYDVYHCTSADPANNCEPAAVALQQKVSDNSTYFAGLSFGGGVLIFGITLAGGIRSRKRIALLIAVIAVTCALVASCGSGNNDSVGQDNNNGHTPDDNNKTYTVSGLNSNTTYYWTVIAKDSNGGETQSSVWSFKTQ